jgi:poly-gamma-glutamate synthesis protein (capsule biosynthesis protein)
VNGLRLNRVVYVNRDDLEALFRIKCGILGLPSVKLEALHVDLWETRFICGEEVRADYEIETASRARLLNDIVTASTNSDVVVVSFHTHENDGRSDNAAGFIGRFFRECVNAGADIVFVHGPHLLRGVEFYNKGLIFHSLGNFVFQPETIDFIPFEVFEQCGFRNFAISEYFGSAFKIKFERPDVWESAFVNVRINAASFEVTIHPLDLKWLLPQNQRGNPTIASGASADRILSRFVELSYGLGTFFTKSENVCFAEFPRG